MDMSASCGGGRAAKQTSDSLQPFREVEITKPSIGINAHLALYILIWSESKAKT